ncbi:hypothetical protein DVH05_009954 [Phytophthora capsici]|nr:hypothetical protein DVH05_009954 [Phytophthora capsici]
MKLFTIFAFAVIYCTSVKAANLRRFLEDIDSGSSDFSDSSAAGRSLEEFDASIDSSSVDGELSSSASEDGSTFRLLEETESSGDSLDEDNVDSSYHPGTVKPASFDASGSFDEPGVLWWK